MMASIKVGSLRRRVAAYLFDAILHGELLPGQRIIEARLSRELEIAQNTLREGLQDLEHQGLVVKYDGRGTYVTKLTSQQIQDIYAVRLQLEPMAAALAHQRLNSEYSLRLSSLLEKMRAAGERQEFLEVSKADLAFHQLVWKLSGNEALERALNVISIPLFAFYAIRLYSGDAYDLKTLHEEHCSLLTILKNGGPKEVTEGFREKLEFFRVQHVQYLRGLEKGQGSPSGQTQSVL